MKITTPNADEFPLVFDAWARSFKKSPWAGCVPNHLWDQVSRECAQQIVARGARVLVAVVDLPDGTRRVMGYSVSEPAKKVLHWLFVKRDYRGNGIGRMLLKETVLHASSNEADRWTYTHRTRASANFLGPRFEWDPTAARVK